MRLEFGVEDEDAFHAGRAELLQRFDRWRGSRERDTARWTADLLLQFKWGYLDGHLGRWSPGDLWEILAEIFPRKVVMDPDDVAGVIPSARQFLAFLAETGLLDSRSAEPERLHAALDIVAEELPERMGDETRFGLAKSLFSGGREPAPVLPLAGSVTLPSTGELVQEAAAVPLLGRLRTFARWASEDRPLTAKGNLTLADGRALIDLLGTNDRMDPDIGGTTFKTTSTVHLREVNFAFRLARSAGFVKVRKGRLSATRRGMGLGDDPVADWHDALDGLLALGVLRHRYEHNRYIDPYWKDLVDGQTRALLWSLLDGQPQDIDDLGERMWEVVEGTYVLDDLDDEMLAHHRERLAWDTRTVVEALDSIGAVSVRDVRLESVFEGLERPTGGVASLTKLGVAGAYRLALAAGFDVPATGTLRGAAATALLAGIRDLDPEAAEAEAAAWLADREADEAARQLVRAMEGAGDAALIEAAFRMLGELPDSVTAKALRDCAASEPLMPFVEAWMALRGPDTARPAPEPTAGYLLAVVTIGGADALVAALAAAGDTQAQCAVLDRLRAEGAPAVPALQRVADEHPDKVVAKAARKALFKLRSASVPPATVS